MLGGCSGIKMSEAALNDLWKFDAVHHMWEEIKSEVETNDEVQK